jgi:hypothetical protein
MQAIHDIFALWPSISAMANDLNENSDTVLRWKYRGRIPEPAWPKVIERSAALGQPVTAEFLLAVNTPMKQRGWLAHKKQRAKVVRLKARSRARAGA